MSNHLSKSLFSIPRLKKSRSRQQNQPENPTSLCLNALTADDAFLRFAAALDKTFSPRATPNGILLFSFAFPVCRVPFRPSQPERNFIFSLYIHPPSAAARGSRAALQYFRSYRPPFTTRGTGSPNMPNTSNDRARNALRSTETEKFSRPQTLRPPHIGAQGRPYKMNTRKNRIHRRGGRRGIIGRRKWQQEIYYTGIIGRERSSGSIIHGFSASEGVAGI